MYIIFSKVICFLLCLSLVSRLKKYNKIFDIFVLFPLLCNDSLFFWINLLIFFFGGINPFSIQHTISAILLFSHVNHGRRSSSSSSRGAPVDCQLLPTERKFSVRVVVPYNFFSFLAGTPKFVCFFSLLLLRGVNFLHDSHFLWYYYTEAKKNHHNNN